MALKVIELIRSEVHTTTERFTIEGREGVIEVSELIEIADRRNDRDYETPTPVVTCVEVLARLVEAD